MPDETAPVMPTTSAIAEMGVPSRHTETAARAVAFAERIDNALQVIEAEIDSNPQILAGAPVLKGTRFSVTQFFAELAVGESIDTIASDFQLSRESLSSVLHALAVYLEQPDVK